MACNSKPENPRDKAQKATAEQTNNMGLEGNMYFFYKIQHFIF